jgi:hypothetical protein
MRNAQWVAVQPFDAAGEQPRRCVVVCRAEPELARQVIHPGDAQQLLNVVIPGKYLAELLLQALARAGQSARASVITANCRETTHNSQDGRVGGRAEVTHGRVRSWCA